VHLCNVYKLLAVITAWRHFPQRQAFYDNLILLATKNTWIFTSNSLYFHLVCNQIWILTTNYKKVSNIKFHENLYGGAKMKQTYDKLIGTFHTFKNAPTRRWCHCCLITTLVNIMIYLLLHFVNTVVRCICKSFVQSD
jgi:hypothetical protein